MKKSHLVIMMLVSLLLSAAAIYATDVVDFVDGVKIPTTFRAAHVFSAGARIHGVSENMTHVNSTYEVLPTDDWIGVTMAYASTGGFPVKLSGVNPATYPGKKFGFIRLGLSTNGFSLAPAPYTVNGSTATTAWMDKQYDTMELVSDGSGYIIYSNQTR